MPTYTLIVTIEMKVIHGFSIVESKNSKRLKKLEELVKDKKSGLKFDSIETFSKEIKDPLKNVKIIRFYTNGIIRNKHPHFDKEIQNGDLCEIKYRTRLSKNKENYLKTLIHIKKI